MTRTKATIPRETADDAREDIEAFNKDLIAREKAAETPSHTILRLRADDSLKRLQKAFQDFDEVRHSSRKVPASTDSVIGISA